MSNMCFKRLLRPLFEKKKPVEQVIRSTAISISEQLPGKDGDELISMIEGMLSANELALAVHSLRTGFEELGSGNEITEKVIRDLESEFKQEILKLLQ